jgi:hypothetical protein
MLTTRHSPPKALVLFCRSWSRWSWIKIGSQEPRRKSKAQSRKPSAVVGDAKLQSDGKAEQTAGKIQNAIGGMKDTVREIIKK